MSEKLCRQAVYDVLKGIADIGKVYDYDRSTGDDWAKFIELFKDTRSSRILGWELSRGGVQAEKISNIEDESGHQYVIRGYMGLKDADKTEITFNDKIELIRDTFRGNNTLGGLCLDISAISVPVIEPRTFGSVLCHYAELRFTVTVRKDIGDPGEHRIYGKLEPGKTVTIDEEYFGDKLFERPDPEWLSPHEKADKDRAAELATRVGKLDPPPASTEPAPAGKKDSKEGK